MSDETGTPLPGDDELDDDTPVVSPLPASGPGSRGGRVRVESSVLRSVGYNPRREELTVEFQHLGVYRYFEVPPELYEEMMAAESKGTYFNAHIRDFPHIIVRSRPRSRSRRR